MAFWKRLFGFGKAEAAPVQDRLQDPIERTQKSIDDLRKELDASMTSLGQAKAQTITRRRDLEHERERAVNYERRAMLMLQKGQNGQLAKAEADRLAGEALGKKERCEQSAGQINQQLAQQDAEVANLEASVRAMEGQINSWENELHTLRARAKVAAANVKLNKQMALSDEEGTVALLEEMRVRVTEDETLAEGYAQLVVDPAADFDAQLRARVASNEQAAAEQEAAGQEGSLEALKAKMGID